MYRGLVDNLAYVYAFIARGKDKLDPSDLKALKNGADTLTRNAPAVLKGADEKTTRKDDSDLQEAILINTHIDEMVVFQLSLDIV